MKRLACLLSLLLAATAGLAQTQSKSDIPPYKNPRLPVEQRVQDLLGRMTLQEKVAMLSGVNWMQSVPNDRLGIPSIKMADGPLGIRSWDGPSAQTNAMLSKIPVTTTACPAGIATTATRAPEIAPRQCQAIGEDVEALGRDMI